MSTEKWKRIPLGSKHALNVFINGFGFDPIKYLDYDGLQRL